MILPTYAGHDEIWCGGQGVTLSVAAAVVGLGAAVGVETHYSLEDLTVHSSACSFQGHLSPRSFLNLMLGFGRSNSFVRVPFKHLLVGNYRLQHEPRGMVTSILGFFCNSTTLTLCFLWQIFLPSVMTSNEKLSKWIRIAAYHLVGWGIPFMLMLIPTSANKMGFAPGATL